jgi:hypothetical protein
VVQRRPPTAYMVDIERSNPDSPELDIVDIEREATLILLAAIAAKEGPTVGRGDAGGPGTAAGVTPKVAHGGAKDAGGLEEAAGGPDPPSGKDGEEGGGQEASVSEGRPLARSMSLPLRAARRAPVRARQAPGREAVTVKRAAVTDRAVMRAEATETLKWRWSWSTPL